MTASDIHYALKNHVGVYPDDVSTETLREAGCMDTLMPLPDRYEDRISHIGNLLAQMCNGVRGKDEKLIMDLRIISSSLSYLINSASFQDGQYFDFDQSVINTRLRRLV